MAVALSLTASTSWREFHGISCGLEDVTKRIASHVKIALLSRKCSVALQRQKHNREDLQTFKDSGLERELRTEHQFGGHQPSLGSVP